MLYLLPAHLADVGHPYRGLAPELPFERRADFVRIGGLDVRIHLRGRSAVAGDERAQLLHAVVDPVSVQVVEGVAPPVLASRARAAQAIGEVEVIAADERLDDHSALARQVPTRAQPGRRRARHGQCAGWRGRRLEDVRQEGIAHGGQVVRSLMIEADTRRNREAARRVPPVLEEQGVARVAVLAPRPALPEFARRTEIGQLDLVHLAVLVQVEDRA